MHPQAASNNQLDAAFLINPFPENLFRTCRITGDHMYAAMHKPIRWPPMQHRWIFMRWTVNANHRLAGERPAAVLTTVVPWRRSIPYMRLASSHNLDVVNTMQEDMELPPSTLPGAARDEPRHSHTPTGIALPGYLYGCVPLYCADESPPAQVILMHRTIMHGIRCRFIPTEQE